MNYIITLKNNIADQFNSNELSDLCFELGINHEEIPGNTLSEKARELVNYAERHGLLSLLVERCRDFRPHTEWPELTTKRDYALAKEQDSSELLSSFREHAKTIISKKKSEIPFDLGDRPEYEEISKVNTDGNRTTGLVAKYPYGMVIWHDYGMKARQAFTVHGGIGHRYKKMGERRWTIMGLPITDEEEAAPSPYGSTGRYNMFENGVIVWHREGRFRDQSYAVWGPISDTYNSIGGTGSVLGFPVSEVYSNGQCDLCEFEGGVIVSLSNSDNPVIVHKLLSIDYSDTPFNHGWKQHTGPTDSECTSVRFGTGIGSNINFVAFNFPWESRSIKYPALGFPPNKIKEQYCALTVKSLSPQKWYRFYVKVETNSSVDQYLDFDSQRTKEKFSFDEKENVEYWKMSLPENCDDGEWKTFIIDLRRLVYTGFHKPFEWLRRFHFRGSIGIANIFVSENAKAIEQIAINPVYLK